MSITVEDGSVVANANSYVSVDDCNVYCADRGLTFADSPSAPAEQALVRATAAIDAKYGNRFSGYRAKGRLQVLEWPRAYALDRRDVQFLNAFIPSSEIPVEIKNAVCEMAVRELAQPGATIPDLDRGGQIRAIQAGSVSVTYGDNAAPNTMFQLVDGILAPLLTQAIASFSGEAVRG